jgi:hypothetical protein
VYLYLVTVFSSTRPVFPLAIYDCTICQPSTPRGSRIIFELPVLVEHTPTSLLGTDMVPEIVFCRLEWRNLMLWRVLCTVTNQSYEEERQ